MRIAQIATVSSPVRKDHAGSVETIVWLLAKELTQLGHEVTTFACAGSQCDGTIVETLPGPYGEDGAPDDWTACEWINLCKAVSRSGDFDVVHSHAYLWGVTLHELSRCPMVNTLHIIPYETEAQLWQMHPDAKVSAISNFQWSAFPELQPCATIPHGVDESMFNVQLTPDNDPYVCYLGRFIPNKGPIEAIAAARAIGIPIKLAGPRNDYFDEQIAPLIDGKSAIYVGPVNASERNAFLSGACALVYPLNEPEPFGLVQIESMFCGTPVAAINIGAVPEIIDEGITGSLAKNIQQLSKAITNTIPLNRQKVAQHARTKFSSTRMARDYVSLYQSMK